MDKEWRNDPKNYQYLRNTGKNDKEANEFLNDERLARYRRETGIDDIKVLERTMRLVDKKKYSDDYGKNYQYGENMSKTHKNIITSTGICETNVANNIYDLAGNVWDATRTPMKSNNDFHLCFGGHYDTPRTPSSGFC